MNVELPYLTTINMLDESYYWMLYFMKENDPNNREGFNSYLLMCILVNANFLSIVMIICHLLYIDLTQFSDLSKGIGLFTGISLMTICFVKFFLRRKAIRLKYDQLSQDRRKKGKVIFWLYSILSLAILFTLGLSLS